MKTTFTSILSGKAEGPTGIEVPQEAMAQLGTKKTPAVKVHFAGYSYQSTVAVTSGKYMIPVSAAHRKAAGVKAGDLLEVTLELDLEPRTVEVPEDLALALVQSGLQGQFDALAPSKRKEAVRQVEEAKTTDTRQRRIQKIVDSLRVS